MTTGADLIEMRLKEALAPERLEIIDESAAHAGHAGAIESGGGHYHVMIVSAAFDGKGLVQRHQIVYKALGDLMKSHIHALSIKAYAPAEFDHQ